MEASITLLLMLLLTHYTTVLCLHLEDPEWVRFKAKYSKTYSSAGEEATRLAIFRTNLRRIADHNASGSSFRMAVNHMADLSAAEYRALLTRTGAPVASPAAAGGHTGPSRDPGVGVGLDYKDWREEGAVTNVKRTGPSCGGGSWAFAAVAAVEGAWRISGRRLVTLSEQQLIDCSNKYGSNGCEDGLAQQAFDYLMKSEGLSSENDYPYRQNADFICRRIWPVASISNWVQTTRGSEVELEHVVANVGPVAARIDASHTSFQLYSGGVYDQRPCSTSDLNLAVSIVGFGVEDVYGRDVPYWLVKNAWGPGWGESGYIKIRKDEQNMCGIATDVVYPVV